MTPDTYDPQQVARKGTPQTYTDASDGALATLRTRLANTPPEAVLEMDPNGLITA